MASKQMTMTDGPLARQIMAFSIPLMISNVLQVLFNMADIAVAGRFAGPEALGAVGSTTILVTLFIGIVIGMGSGVNVTVARFLGAGQEKDVCESVHTSLILCLLVGLALAAVGVGGTHAIMTAMHTKPELIGGAERYLHIYFLGMPALGAYNFGNAVLSADGDTRHPLIFLSAAGVLNVVLNLFFVVVCQLGVTGGGDRKRRVTVPVGGADPAIHDAQRQHHLCATERTETYWQQGADDPAAGPVFRRAECHLSAGQSVRADRCQFV